MAVGMGRVDGLPAAILVLYPTLIAPLFSKFTPRGRAGTLNASGASDALRFCPERLFVMDGSKRSGHGNAYFTGFGRAKRIVFFDTLLTRLVGQVEAVLAHELGHYN